LTTKQNQNYPQEKQNINDMITSRLISCLILAMACPKGNQQDTQNVLSLQIMKAEWHTSIRQVITNKQ
jgi:hypothetical protein